jgi:FlaA1/EpsC-like NDP-sugar epimerase
MDVTELLGRRPVEIDLASVAGRLRGKRVLVTGAGGSIGSELCRQIHRFGPAELFMLDRDETALHGVQLSIHGEARLDSPSLVLADIRDAEAMRELLRELRPELVFHAAALKHLPVLERHPDEAWKTNVLGTMNVLDAARMAGVRRFVNISTDKAANPASVLGRSKRVAERLVADAAGRTDGIYLSVRFGNVLGSRGSVLTTFAEQLAVGAPLTVTHPEVTRFFMTVPEAVQLVLQAAAIGASGEALVLDMGSPARIRDLAEQLIEMSGSDARIVFTGLGPGEKLHEELFGEGEQDRRPVHPAISHIQVPPLPARIVLARHSRFGSAAALAELVECPRIVAPRTSSPVEMDRMAALSGKRAEPR